MRHKQNKKIFLSVPRFRMNVRCISQLCHAATLTGAPIVICSLNIQPKVPSHASSVVFLFRCSPTMSYHHPTKHRSTLDFKQRPSKYSSSDLQHKNQILNFKFTSCSAIYILVMVKNHFKFAIHLFQKAYLL
jgi:hypothetical protein